MTDDEARLLLREPRCELCPQLELDGHESLGPRRRCPPSLLQHVAERQDSPCSACRRRSTVSAQPATCGGLESHEQCSVTSFVSNRLFLRTRRLMDEQQVEDVLHETDGLSLTGVAHVILKTAGWLT